MQLANGEWPTRTRGERIPAPGNAGINVHDEAQLGTVEGRGYFQVATTCTLSQSPHTIPNFPHTCTGRGEARCHPRTRILNCKQPTNLRNSALHLFGGFGKLAQTSFPVPRRQVRTRSSQKFCERANIPPHSRSGDAHFGCTYPHVGMCSSINRGVSRAVLTCSFVRGRGDYPPMPNAIYLK